MQVDRTARNSVVEIGKGGRGEHLCSGPASPFRVACLNLAHNPKVAGSNPAPATDPNRKQVSVMQAQRPAGRCCCLWTGVALAWQATCECSAPARHDWRVRKW